MLSQVSGAAGDAAKKDLERKIKKIGMTLVQVCLFDDIDNACDGDNEIKRVPEDVIACAV